MKQIWLIHGGHSFNSMKRYLEDLKSLELDYDRFKLPDRKWRDWLVEQMPEADILLPNMPNGHNAQFDEWRIYFEKLIPFFSDDVSLVGHSLGAMFLSKYLNDHPLPSKVKQIILISPAYDDETIEDCGSFRTISAKNLTKSSDNIHLFHSQDDPAVPFSELAKFQADLPNAKSHIFTDRGHFLDPEFREMLDLLS